MGQISFINQAIPEFVSVFKIDTLVLKHKSVEMDSLAKPCLYLEKITEWHYISVPTGSALTYNSVPVSHT
jgi:hypothetical protein